MDAREIRYGGIMAQRVIICVDMDAYFASVEQKSNPRLQGKPVAVIGSGKRTVITTRSYEARKYGVKTGMTIYEAMRLCPDIIFVVGNNEKYTYTCSVLESIYKKYSPDVEIYSIDEAFIDITNTYHLFGSPLDVGRLIKMDVKRHFGINCTIGIAPNILMAKLVSDLNKPDGLKEIQNEEIPNLLHDIPVDELWGIGSQISKRLADLGIKTCGQLGDAPASLLRNKFGIIGERLKEMGLGICRREIKTKEEDPKSIGHSITLPKDISDIYEIKRYILMLTEMVCKRARKYGFAGKVVSLTVRLPDFETFSRQMVMQKHTNITHEVYKSILSILYDIRLRQPVRLLGVSLTLLVKDNDKQEPLFDDFQKDKRLYSAIDEINDKYGDFRITWGAYVSTSKGSYVISPAWRPSGVRNIKVI